MGFTLLARRSMVIAVDVMHGHIAAKGVIRTIHY